jgi:hypothetical protein
MSAEACCLPSPDARSLGFSELSLELGPKFATLSLIPHSGLYAWGRAREEPGIQEAPNKEGELLSKPMAGRWRGIHAGTRTEFGGACARMKATPM